jgi:hypothetical protein
MQHDILGRNAEKDMGIRVRNLATATPLKSTSVSDGHTEFNGPRSLVVNGSQYVSGLLEVDGTADVGGLLKVGGVFAMEGNAAFTGRVIVTGPTDLDGDTDITGTTNITGPTTITGKTNVTGDIDIAGLLKLIGNALLTGDLVVGAGGEITVAGSPSATLGVTASGYPGLEWSGAGWVAAIAGNGVVLSNSTGSAFARVTATAAALVAGAKSVQVTSSAVTITGLPQTTEKPNLYIHPTTGVLYRSTAISA